MSHSGRKHRTLLSVLSLSVSFGLAVGPALAQGVPDIRKSAIETPMKSLIRGTTAPTANPALPTIPLVPSVGRADMGKMGIERPTKSLIRGSFLMESLQKAPKPEALPARLPETAVQLPELEAKALSADKVKPGRIQWHSTFQKAMAASARSGKPVFLFHMMGRLDDRFC